MNDRGSADADPRILQQIRHWDSCPPAYRWMDLIARRQTAGEAVGAFPPGAYTYVSLTIYDATIAAWNAKHTYRRARP